MNQRTTDETEMFNSTICRQCPILKKSEDTLDFINRVRRFATINCPEGIQSNTLCDTFYRIPFQRFPVDTFLTIFESNRGIANCGSTSTIMAKILDENGIRAYTYNFGFLEGRYNHVVVLVPYKGKLIIQDPYISYTLKDNQNNYLDFFDLITHIRNDSINNIEVLSDTIVSKIIINVKETIQLYSGIPIECFPNYSPNKEVFTQNQLKHFGYKTAGCSDFTKDFENELEKHGYPPNILYAYTLKIHTVYGSVGHELLNSQIDSFLNK